MDRLHICQTCVRDLALAHGTVSRGCQLSDTVRMLLDQLPLAERLVLRRVPCLSGCLSPCNAALRGSGKASLRFSRLQPSDAQSLLDVAAAYVDSIDGDLPDDSIHAALRDHLSARTPPPKR